MAVDHRRIFAIDARIAIAREGLIEKLGELRRRGTRARALLRPSRYLDNPWLRLGVGIALGYAIRARRAAHHALPAAPAAREDVVVEIVKTGVVALAKAVVRRTFSGR